MSKDCPSYFPAAAVKCVGHTAPVGTGPFRFEKKLTTTRTIGLYEVANATLDGSSSERVTEVHFLANRDYWGGAPAMDRLVVRAYASHEEVMAALLDGSLDIAYGSGTLQPQNFKSVVGGGNKELVGQISPPVSTRLIALNSARYAACLLGCLAGACSETHPPTNGPPTEPLKPGACSSVHRSAQVITYITKL
jgi:ABC-type transport system substrate-binding protein